MKKVVKSIMAVLILSAILIIGDRSTVSAYGTYEYGNLYYTLTSDGKDVVVTGCKKGTTNLTIPEKIDGMDVVGVNGNAFRSNSDDLVSVNAESINYIGSYAFYYCTNLKKIYAPNATYIGERTFYECKNLSDVVIGQNENSKYRHEIDSNAFTNCKALENINTGCIDGIGEEAFEGCSSLRTVTMPSVSVVETSVFEDCTSLESVDMPSVTKVYRSAFEDCNFLKNVQMPSVKIVEEDAFYNCKNLESVSMNNVSKIGDYAFLNTNLTKICFASDVSSVGDHALGYDYEEDKYGRGVWTPKEDFTIHAPKNTNIYAYAIDNGFNYEDHSLKIKSETKATCTKDGKRVEECPICGYEKTTKLSKYGHSYNAGVITVKPTNTKNGKKTYTCKRCGAKKTIILKAYKTLAIEKYKKYVSNLYDRKYKIEDVDKNGIPELLVKNFDDIKVAAYTYNPKTNKMVNLKSLRYGKGGWVMYNTKTHYLAFGTSDTGGYREYFYKLSGSKLKKVRTITYNNGKFKKQGYKINKKKISNKKYKKYIKGFKTLA